MPTYMDEFIEQMKSKKAKPAEDKKTVENASQAPAAVDDSTEKIDFEKLEQRLKEIAAKKEAATAKPGFSERVAALNPQKMPEVTLKTGEPKHAQLQEEIDQREEMQVDMRNWKLVTQYGDVKIYQPPDEKLAVYFAPTINPSASEKTIINTIREAATRIITITPYRIRDPLERKNLYFQKVMEILQNSPQLRIPARRFEFYAESVVRDMIGYGIIDPLVNDDTIEEIMVIGPKKPVYVFHRKYEMMTTNIMFYSDQEIVDLVNRIARQVGRRVDISAPMLDARLADGSRVNATIPPASVDGSTLTIRKFKKDPYSMIDLINMNTMDSYTAAFLWGCVDGFGVKPANILISGGTGSGKTTTLNSLAAFISPWERIVSIEDTAELFLPLKHWIRFEARPPSLEGKGELSLDILTKNSLRMRPDRIIVGEVRHQEAFTLFTAINTGHEGALTEEASIQLSDGRIESIGKFAEKQFSQKTSFKEGNFEFVETENDGIFAPSFNKKTLKFEHKKITRVWKKTGKQELVKIKLKSGKTIRLTEDHPIYRIQEGVQEIRSGEAKKGDFLATPRQIPLVAKEKIKEPYLTGLILGGGHIRDDRIELTNKNSTLIQIFSEKMQNLSQNKLAVKNYENYFRARVFDTQLAKNISTELSIPKGDKTKTFKLTEEMLKSAKEDIGQIVSGLFDADCHVNPHSNCIQFATSNKDVAKKMPLILQRFGITSSVYIQKKDGKGHIGPYFIISIYGKDNLEKFNENIGLKHTGKTKELENIIAKAKNSQDVFPNISQLLRNLRLDSKITQSELGKLIGNKTFSTILAYEIGTRKPSREQLKKIFEATTQGNARSDLQTLINSDFRFEQIVEITHEETKETVYDLTVEDNHNYIANGMLVSNCMGTVHANSAYETIIRVTSPPMNVPPVMISSLDFVVVEHRLHDKKKGTIRRISEISEVVGALEGKAKTSSVFEYDRATDTMKRVKKDPQYIKTIADYMGKTPDFIEKLILKREKFLKELIENEIRSLPEVSKKCTEYTLTER